MILLDGGEGVVELSSAPHFFTNYLLLAGFFLLFFGLAPRRFIGDLSEWTVCLFVLFIYFISSGYITHSNDGSHFALVSAIVEKHSVAINDYMGYTWGVDYSIKDGSYYSDRTPGTAFLALPFYIFGKIMESSGLTHLFSPSANIKEVTVLLLPNIAGAATVYLVYIVLITLGLRKRTALLSSAVFAFSTLVWFESTHLMSHAISSALVMAAFYVSFRAKKMESAEVIFLSGLLAYASIVEIQNIIFIPLFAGYLLMSKRISIQRNARGIVGAVLVFAAIYSLLIGYNFAAFGEFTVKSNRYNPNFPEEKTFASSLSGNPVSGVFRLLVGSDISLAWDYSRGTKNNIPGILIVSPIYILGIMGLKRLYGRYKLETLLLAGVVAAEIFVVSLHKTVLTRHIATVYPLLFLPAAYYIEDAVRGLSRRNYFPAAIVALLAIASVTRVFYSINTYWGRDLWYPTPYIDELPTFMVFFGIIYLTYKLARKGR